MPFDINRYVDDNSKDKKPKKTKEPKNIKEQEKPSKNKKRKIKRNINIDLNKNTTIIIVVLILAFTYIYVEQNKINYKEKLRQEEQIKVELNQKAYNACIENADDSYNLNWNKACKRLGRKDDCALPSYNANAIEKWHSDTKNECMNKLKNNAF